MNERIRAVGRLAKGFLPFLEPVAAILGDLRCVRAASAFVRDWRTYDRLYTPGDPFPLRFAESQAMPYSRYRPQAGKIPRHYFHQDLWAARKVFASGVAVHHDLGSRVDGFIAHCLAFCQVVMIDIRPLDLAVEGLSFIQADARDLSAIPSGSVASLSSLHALEHIGLGRYGDPVDPSGHLKAASELQRILAPGGNLYFSTPVGRERLVFNKHRIFSPAAILDLFQGLRLVSLSAETAGRRFIPHAAPGDLDSEDPACGMFHFRKPF